MRRSVDTRRLAKRGERPRIAPGETQYRPESPTAAGSLLTRRFPLLLHIDSPRRLRLYQALLSDESAAIDTLSPLPRRMIQMLTFRLLQGEAKQEGVAWDAGLMRLRQNASAAGEFGELCDALLELVQLHAGEDPIVDESPLFLYRQYTRDEVLVALGLAKLVGTFPTQTGRFWIPELHTEVLFVTLDKSEKTFSPSTRYEDFALSPTRFHWQSQSTTSADSPTGQRYARQRENGARFLLFVRPKKNNAFVFLGPLRYVSHLGSRPMSIHWDLEYPMPAWFFEICASLRAA